MKFDGLTGLDPGKSVPAIQIDHDALDTPTEVSGSVLDYLVQSHDKLRSLALDLMLQQHAQLFQYEDGNEARNKLEILLSELGAVTTSPEQADTEPWMVGDAMRLELVIKAAEFQLIKHEPKELTEFAVIEMTRNGYRRLHRLEQPLGAQFFNVFMQTSQPTQVPFDVLYSSVIEDKQLSQVEAIQVMRENPSFWKTELQSLGNMYLVSVCHEPALMTLQNAALYQQLKAFFGEDDN